LKSVGFILNHVDFLITYWFILQKILLQETGGHENIRDSRALWLGDKDMIYTTGFSRVSFMSKQEVHLFRPLESKIQECLDFTLSICLLVAKIFTLGPTFYNLQVLSYLVRVFLVAWPFHCRLVHFFSQLEPINSPLFTNCLLYWKSSMLISQ
jgi:hypothetical protein